MPRELVRCSLACCAQHEKCRRYMPRDKAVGPGFVFVDRTEALKAGDTGEFKPFCGYYLTTEDRFDPGTYIEEEINDANY